MNRKSILGLLVALGLPLACYLWLKSASENAVDMPRKYLLDTVVTRIEKGKEITDSIKYAQKIQQAVLPSHKFILDELKKNKKLLLNISVEEVEYKLESNDFVQEQMIADDLMKLIQDMPAGYRVIFNMFAIEGYAHQEIATQLGISESTSKSQYLRARAYSKNRIDKR